MTLSSGPAASAPPVTAVVPTHNRPELMREAVRSIVEQDYAGDIEVLVVFDACDVVPPDLPRRPGRTVRGLPNARTRGLAGARNTGISAASHDFVAFLDDDDEWLPGKLAAQIAVFEARPDLALVGTAMRVVNASKGTHDRLVPDSTVTHDQLVEDRLAGLHSSSFLFRRSALTERIGLIDEHLPGSYAEDYDVLLRTARFGSIHVVNQPLVAVRWTGESYFYGQWTTYAAALCYLLDHHPEFASHPQAMSRVESQIAFALAAGGDRRASRSWAWRALSRQHRNLRAWIALLVSFRLAPAGGIARAANYLGRGI